MALFASTFSISTCAIVSQPHPALALKTFANAAEQANFLDSSVPGLANMPGSFEALASSLYAANDIAMHTLDPEINRTHLEFNFASNPTWREYFDEIARQTKSQYAFDPKSNNWVFSRGHRNFSRTLVDLLPEPRMDGGLPYSLNLASAWTSEDRGLYITYKPPSEPVGMDIYMLGRSTTKAEKDLKKLTEYLAIDSARHIKPDASLAAMSLATVDGASALYFECPTSRPGVFWRQWVFIKDSHVFKIVSALPEGNEKLVAELQSMVASFKVQ